MGTQEFLDSFGHSFIINSTIHVFVHLFMHEFIPSFIHLLFIDSFIDLSCIHVQRSAKPLGAALFSARLCGAHCHFICHFPSMRRFPGSIVLGKAGSVARCEGPLGSSGRRPDSSFAHTPFTLKTYKAIKTAAFVLAWATHSEPWAQGGPDPKTKVGQK